MKEKISLTGVIAGIILILIAGFLRISHFGTEIVELELLIYIVIIFFAFLYWFISKL